MLSRRTVLRVVAGAALFGLVSSAMASETPEVLCARGVLAYQGGDTAGAATLLEKAVQRRPEMIDARHYLGLALIRQGKQKPGRRALSAAVRVAGDAASARLLLDLGLAYLAEENFPWAIRVLQRAAVIAPRNGKVRYHLGVAMLRLDDAAAATEHLVAAETLPGVDRRDAKIQLAIAHYMDGRWRPSREQLDGLLFGRNGATARRLMRASYEGEGIDAALFSAELSSGGLIDTNPLFEHETTAPTAAGLSLAGMLALRPWVGARHVITGRVAAERVFYFPTASEDRSTVDDASRTDLRASARLTRFLGAAQALSASYHFGLTFLDADASSGAGEPTLVDENHIFVESHGGQLSYQLKMGNHQLQARYRLGRQAFADLPRSHVANELSLQWLTTLRDGRIRLIGDASARHELAYSADYDALAPAVSFGGSTVVVWDIVLGLRVGYEYKNHYRSDESERWGNSLRADHRLELTAEVARALPLGFRAGLVYQRLQNLSSVQSFDYGRDLLSLSLSWSYAP